MDIENLFESTLDGVQKWEDIDFEAILQSDEDDEEKEIKTEPNEVKWTKAHVLSRKYIYLYGRCPKMDSKLYSGCKLCGLVFNPVAVGKHRETCTGLGRLPSQEEGLSAEVAKHKTEPIENNGGAWKKVRAINKIHYTPENGTKVEIWNLLECKSCGLTVKSQEMPKHKQRCTTSKEEIILHRPKMNHSRDPGVHIGNPHLVKRHRKMSKFRSSSQPIRKRVKSKKLEITNVVSLPPVFNRESQNWSPVLSKYSELVLFKNSKVKKLKRSRVSEHRNKEDRNVIVHGTTGGPRTRSISHSNDRSHSRKSGSNKSKSSTSSSSDRRPSKDTIRHSPSSSSSPQQPTIVKAHVSVQEKPIIKHTNQLIFTPLTKEIEVVKVLKIEPKREIHTQTSGAILMENGYYPIQKKCTKQVQVVKVADVKKEMIAQSGGGTVLVNPGYCPVEKKCTPPSPVLYFRPISPIIVVTPIQFKENTVFMDASPGHPALDREKKYFIPIPEPVTNVKLCSSHPKPTVLPTFGARKIGGAILGSNQRLEYQLKDIQAAISSNSTAGCKSTTFNVPASRSFLIKAEGISTKVNCKKSREKISVGDSKRAKLPPDVNGFILHTDLSEVAETPQANHCIQENINLLNMK